MNNRFKNQTQMTTACKILQEMLNQPTSKLNQSTEVRMSLSSTGDAILTFTEVKTDEKNTNALIRAKFACDAGMVVSPLSNNKSGIFYTTPDNFKTELQEAERLAEEENQNWFSRIKKGISK